MTPCKKLGYKAGDKFVVVREGNRSVADVGDVLTLGFDDGTDRPHCDVEGSCCRILFPHINDIVKLDGDGWIGWKGGEMPVDSETLVDVVYRDGDRNTSNKKACRYSWCHHGASGDIVAYRPLQVEQPAAPTLVELLQAWEKAKADLATAEQDEVAARKALTGAMRAAGLSAHVAVEQPLNITDWRGLRVGDIIWWSGDAGVHAGEYPVSYVEHLDYKGTIPIAVDTGDVTGWVSTCEQWRFVRRPN